MQISRHWRMKPKRYRLEGVIYKNGEVGLSQKAIQKREISNEAIETFIRENTPDINNLINLLTSAFEDQENITYTNLIRQISLNSNLLPEVIIKFFIILINEEAMTIQKLTNYVSIDQEKLSEFINVKITES